MDLLAVEIPVTRPVLRYHGGKWLTADWIIDHMPAHSVYVEPYGGGANVLLRKQRKAAEVYNDLERVVVNVFRVLQDPVKAERLLRRLELTPYARAEFDRTYTVPADDVEAACFTIMRSFMGHGTDSIMRTCRTGFRAKLSDGRSTPAAAWAGWPLSVRSFIARLLGVVIENRDAIGVIRRMDMAETLFYVDPPYVTATRSSIAGGKGLTHGYRHEMTDADHISLAGVLGDLKGMVMLSGYPSDLYAGLYAAWYRIDRKALADGARQRTECLWFNSAAAARIPQANLGMEE